MKIFITGSNYSNFNCTNLLKSILNVSDEIIIDSVKGVGKACIEYCKENKLKYNLHAPDYAMFYKDADIVNLNMVIPKCDKIIVIDYKESLALQKIIKVNDNYKKEIFIETINDGDYKRINIFKSFNTNTIGLSKFRIKLILLNNEDSQFSSVGCEDINQYSDKLFNLKHFNKDIWNDLLEYDIIIVVDEEYDYDEYVKYLADALSVYAKTKKIDCVYNGDLNNGTWK